MVNLVGKGPNLRTYREMIETMESKVSMAQAPRVEECLPGLLPRCCSTQMFHKQW